jgi:hypothetical protein
MFLLQNNEALHSTIHLQSQCADLIRQASLIIWDELPGANVAALECADEICRAITNVNAPFGGIPFIGLGDFRQIAPVVKGHGPTASLSASVRSSPIWSAFNVFTLNHAYRSAQDPEYTAFVDVIGEDHTHDHTSLDILQTVPNLAGAVQFLYPLNILSLPVQCLKRAFLSPRNMYVDDFNALILARLPERECASTSITTEQP